MRHPNRKKKVKNSWIKRYWVSDMYLHITDMVPDGRIIYNDVMGKVYASMTKSTYRKLVKEFSKYIIWRKYNA